MTPQDTFQGTVILDGVSLTVELRLLGGALWYAPAGTTPDAPEWVWKIVRITTERQPMTPAELLHHLDTQED